MNLFLAHSLGAAPEASNVDLIVISGGVAALGIMFIWQRNIKMIVSIVMVAAGITGVVLGLTVFKDDDGGGETIAVQGQTFPVSDLTDAVAGLCDARAAAAEGNEEDAETIFINRIHQPLHVIAAAVEDEDREQAARLLEAKQAVETLLFEEKLDAEALVTALDELNAATTVALATLKITAVTC